MENKVIQGKFAELFHLATAHLTPWLRKVLSDIDQENWWKTLVVPQLSYPQAQRVEREEITKLEKLDLAALLRVLEKNWYNISQRKKLLSRDKFFVKEMQTIRNKWSHTDMHGLEKNEIYRDIDNILLFFELITSDKEIIAEIDQFKDDFLKAKLKNLEKEDSENNIAKEDNIKKKCEISVQSEVQLKSDLSKQGIVLEIQGNEKDPRCIVFLDGKKQPFYLSQLSLIEQDDTQQLVSLSELHSLLTCLQIRHPSLSTLYSLNAARIDFVPYQFRPALKIIRSDQPRLLIADSVGVGKTIEAGLILRELQARNDIESVLIICPKPLVSERKWELEMKRFDERFTQLDGNALRYCIEGTDNEGEWPEQHKKTIIPFSLFDERMLNGYKTLRKTQIGLLELNPPPKFDLVIVDEAHHIRNTSTFAHQAVRYFCENAEAVLFLTATPVQMGSRDLFTLLNLLRPDLVIDEETFQHMAEPNRYINQALTEARGGDVDWNQQAGLALDQAANTSWGHAILRNNPIFKSIQKKLSQGIMTREDRVLAIRDIESFHSFSRIINRTRRRDIGNFCLRRPETIETPFTEEQKNLHDKLLSFEANALSMIHGSQNVSFMMSTLRRQAASCIFGLAPYIDHVINRRLSELEWLEADDQEMPDLNFVAPLREKAQLIIEQAENLSPDDPKFDEFLLIILEKQNHKNNKVIVFSSFRHTLYYLEKKLQEEGIRVGLIHGDIKDEDRLMLRKRFESSRETENSIDVMLFSEVGCEGLDYQFCDFMVNYDLPWNPMRIEQRIGRIDRRGQKSEAVAIYNMITSNTVDADIYERCLLRIGVFEESIGDCEEILGDIHREIKEIADNLELTESERQRKLEQLADNEISKIHEQKILEDREHELFGIRLPKFSLDDEVRDAESYWLSANSIQKFILEYLTKRLGIGNFILGEKELKTLRLSKEARTTILDDYRSINLQKTPMNRSWEKWLKGSEQHCSITFDASCATDYRDAHFIMPLHPLVLQAAHFLKTADPVYTSFRINDPDLPSGKFPFAIYAWEYKGTHQELKLVPICNDPIINNNFFEYIEEGVENNQDYILPSKDAFDELENIHHELWFKEKDSHYLKANDISSLQRVSLETSYKARQRVAIEQLDMATNENIRRMKQAHLDNIQNDFERKMKAIDSAAAKTDIHARPVVFGVLIVEGGQCKMQ